MNILHIKYALEVARLGSLNKAAESLLTAQPNISRSIKELEADLGITIFNRSAKGMELTPEGEEFMSYAKEILKQIEGGGSVSQPKARKFSDSESEINVFSAIISSKDSEAADKIRELDINTMTPIEAMNFLFEIKRSLT